MTRPDRSPGWDAIPVAGAGLVILLQICWPLADTALRIPLTVATVLVFAGTCVLHAALQFGYRWALGYLALTAGFAFLIEALGTATGFPFSEYQYGTMLGPRLLSVPLLIPLAWAMTAYPVLLLSRRLTARLAGPAARIAAAAIGGFAMTSWDIFLDPQMVGERYWVWADPLPHLPGVAGIPAVNYLGWLVASSVLMALLGLLPAKAVDERVPAVLWTWTWIGGVIANAFFFDRPGVAAVGGIAMAVVTVPYLWLLIRSRRDPVPAAGTAPVVQART